MPLSPIQPLAIVFDFDGVLVSTGGVWDRAYAALFAAWGAQLGREDRRLLATLPLADLGPCLARLLGFSASPQALADQLLEMIADNVGQPVRVLPGAADLVSTLHGLRLLAVASNSPTSTVHQHLVRVGMAKYFAAIVGCDQVARLKPAPDAYHRACSLLGVTPRAAVAIEDSDIGVAAARAEGLFTIGICPPDRPLPADVVFPSLDDPELWRLLGAGRVDGTDTDTDINCRRGALSPQLDGDDDGSR